MSAADDSRIVKDPICGKDVDTLRARAVGIFGGVTYYFCSAECKSKFKDPRRVPREPTAPGKLAQAETKREKKREPEPAPPKAAEAPEAEAAGGEELADELPAKKSGAGAWVIVAMLFAVAGAVLFFALK